MDWINIIDELPENNTLCWVYVRDHEPFVRMYHRDSFGLNDLDFDVIFWQPFRSVRPLGQVPHFDIAQSI